MLPIFLLARMTCRCVIDKAPDARMRGTRATLAGTRSKTSQRLPLCASDLLIGPVCQWLQGRSLRTLLGRLLMMHAPRGHTTQPWRYVLAPPEKLLKPREG